MGILFCLANFMSETTATKTINKNDIKTTQYGRSKNIFICHVDNSSDFQLKCRDFCDSERDVIDKTS